MHTKQIQGLLLFTALTVLTLSGCNAEDFLLGDTRGPGTDGEVSNSEPLHSDDDDDFGDDDDVSGDDDDDISDLPPPPKADPISIDVEDEACDQVSNLPETWFMSTDDSNSQAAPVQVREDLRDGYTPRGNLRIHEFLNYYSFGFPAAEPGSVRVVPQLRANPDNPNGYSMGVGVVAPHLDPAERRPVDITFSVDTSCSMGNSGIAAVKATMRAVAGSLFEGDTVSVVSWSSQVAVQLSTHPVNGPNDPVVVDVINDLETEGSTNLHAGLVAAYDLAADAQAPGRLNRVILLSDGGANTGVTEEDLIAQHADDAEGEGIYLVGVLTPGSGYNDGLMDTITDLGKGAYIYIPDAAEAERMFTGERFISNLELAARNVRLSLTLPPGFVLDEFHGEEASQDPAEVKPQHLAPNDSMLYHMDLLYCTESVVTDREFVFEVTWEDIETREPLREIIAIDFEDLLLESSDELAKADAIISFAKVFAQLNGSQSSGQTAVASVESRINDALSLLPADPDLLEIQALLPAVTP